MPGLIFALFFASFTFFADQIQLLDCQGLAAGTEATLPIPRWAGYYPEDFSAHQVRRDPSDVAMSWRR